MALVRSTKATIALFDDKALRVLREDKTAIIFVSASMRVVTDSIDFWQAKNEFFL